MSNPLTRVLNGLGSRRSHDLLNESAARIGRSSGPVQGGMHG
jgi:hypothetical protein